MIVFTLQMEDCFKDDVNIIGDEEVLYNVHAVGILLFQLEANMKCTASVCGRMMADRKMM